MLKSNLSASTFSVSWLQIEKPSRLSVLLTIKDDVIADWKTHGSEYYECSRYRENPEVATEANHVKVRGRGGMENMGGN